jgi:hypothetical protein
MKMMRSLVISLVMILLSTPLIYGQDLSKYRNFSFGMSLADLSKQVSSQPLQAKLIQKRPAVIQEVTWWPRESSSSSPSTLQAEPVWQVLFTFHNGELYRILATYDRHATEGLGIEDMVEAISAEYGPATRPDAQISFPTNELYRSTEKVIARWEDSQYSFNLFRSSFLNTFGLVMFSKRLDTQVRAALAESIKLEAGGDDVSKEIAREKKEADKLEVARQINRKTFRP